MTIPEQAVEAAAKADCCPDCDCIPTASYCSKTNPDARARIERILAAAQPLMGVQRPEDVARVQEAFERQFSEYKRNGFTGGDRQDYETLKAAVLALPHTGQPQEGITEGAIEACAARLFGSEWDTKTNRTIARRALEAAEPYRKIGVILSAATSDETLYQTLASPAPLPRR